KVFTFTLRKDAKFHDGKPVTSADVKFSFDAIFDPKFNVAHKRPYYENFEKVEAVDAYTVRFTTKNKYFLNFETAAELDVVPKHFYDVEDGSKKNKTIMGSGPYKLESYDQGQSIMLVRNKDWWGNSVPARKGENNFEHVRFRFTKDQDLAL